MKILIVGLGLMGGAYALRLTKAGHTVYGVDLNDNAIKYAKDKGYIVEGATSPVDFIPKIDLMILSIYPQAILEFLKQYNHLFTSKLIITDICGVKSSFVYEATKLASNAKYCSTHPMAGKEKVGIEYADTVIFEDANYLVVPSIETEKEVIDVLLAIGHDLKFNRFSVIGPEKHDLMIGFTSQLTHAIAVSLVNSDHNKDTINYIGDSYRDLTRIAMINEQLWSELFLENRDFLLTHINSFENELDRLKRALYDNDKEGLEKIFIQSKKIRKEMEK